MEFVLEHEDVQILALIRLSVRRLSDFCLQLVNNETRRLKRNVFRWKDMIIRIISQAFLCSEPRGDTMIECDGSRVMFNVMII